MERLTFNAVLRGASANLDGFFRVVAVPASTQVVWLAYIGALEAEADKCAAVGSVMPVDGHTLASLAEAALLTVVD